MKLVFVLALIVSVVLTSPGNWPAFASYFGITALSILISRLPLTRVLKRSLAVVPFVFFIAIFLPFTRPGETLAEYNLWAWHITISREGTIALAAILMKVWISLLSLVWLSAVTRIADLLQSAGRLGFPRTLVMILSVMYRYIFVIFDEMMRMKQARDCRSPRPAGWREWRSAGHIIGTLFIRSYERSERIYNAMAARGYDGQSHSLETVRLKRLDLMAGTGLLLVLILAGIASFTGWI